MDDVKVDFGGFVMSLAAGAAAALQQVELLRAGKGAEALGGDEAAAPKTPEEVSQHVDANLATARHLIDTLVMLQDKTQGNLTDAEQGLLRDSLTNLRLSFVKLATPRN
jgi:hypothetical protein